MSKTTVALHPRVAMAIRSLDPGLEHGKAWHGAPTLLGVLRGVTAEAALWRPTPDIRCIWQWTLHAGYWKHAAICRLTGNAMPFPRSPHNWPALPDPADAKAWRRDVKLVADTHRQLVETVAHFPPSRLDKVCPGGKTWTAIQLIHGIAEHDLWHTAQIKLITRLARDRFTRP